MDHISNKYCLFLCFSSLLQRRYDFWSSQNILCLKCYEKHCFSQRRLFSNFRIIQAYRWTHGIKKPKLYQQKIPTERLNPS